MREGKTMGASQQELHYDRESGYNTNDGVLQEYDESFGGKP
jgi:hypothetical protein